MKKPPREGPARIASMDQLRGYAIAGMILVNYLGEFNAMPWMLKHHREGMSYADTIAPLFVFVVGMGFRLSIKRRIETVGPFHAYRGALRRYLVLTLLGMVFYGSGDWFRRFSGFAPGELWSWLTEIHRVGWWDALTDIGLAGILALPFINRGVPARILAAFAYAGLYQTLFSLTGYGDWVKAHSYNGGPLGPVSYAFVLLFGTIAYDLLATRDFKKITLWALALAFALSLAGWILKIEWPGVKAAWPFSQYHMTAPYPIYSTGLSFLAFWIFCLVCDVGRVRLPTLTILGENPLVIYMVQAVILRTNQRLFSRDASIEYALAIFVLGYLACYAVARKLHKDRILIKI